MFPVTSTDAIHGDFFTVSGAGFPDDTVVRFSQGGSTIDIAPEFVRPHLVYIESLPATIPLGPNQVTLVSGAGMSDAPPVNVQAGPLSTVCVLNPGAPKLDPYTIMFVANPAIEESTGVFSADPVLAKRAAFQSVVTFSLHNLFNVREGLLRNGDMDAEFRLVCIFDPLAAPIESNSLVSKYPPNLMLNRQAFVRPYINSFGFEADMIFSIHGSTSHNRATASIGADDPAKASTPYEYDGMLHGHGHFADMPGCAAIPLSVDRTGLTVIHEYCHGASDHDNGFVADLYAEPDPDPVTHKPENWTFTVNRKFRNSAGDPVPPGFSSFNAVDFPSDPLRDSLGYEAGWIMYHPALVDPGVPNLMDNYWNTASPQNCLLDSLTADWFTQRLHSKLSR